MQPRQEARGSCRGMFLPGLLKLTLCGVVENEKVVGSVVSLVTEKKLQKQLKKLLGDRTLDWR